MQKEEKLLMLLLEVLFLSLDGNMEAPSKAHKEVTFVVVKESQLEPRLLVDAAVVYLRERQRFLQEDQKEPR